MARRSARFARVLGLFVSLVLLSIATTAEAAGTTVSPLEADARSGAWSFVVTAADVPTLGEWAVIGLLVLMAAYAVWRLRRNPAVLRAGLGVLVLVTSGALVAGVAGSALSVAGHDPATMLSATVNHARTVTARLDADPGHALTGMTLHFHKAGTAWSGVAVGQAAPTPTCGDCWAATLPMTDFRPGDVVEYYLEATVDAAPAFLHAAAPSCDPDPCNGHAASCNAGVCTCAAGYKGATCNACDTGYTGYPTCVCEAGRFGPDCHACASGFQWNAADATCAAAPTAGLHLANGDCVGACPSGLHLASGECVDACPAGFNLGSAPSAGSCAGECVAECPLMHLASGECVDNCCLDQVSEPACEPSPHPWIHETECVAVCPVGTCPSISLFCVSLIDLGIDPLCSGRGTFDDATCTCVCNEPYFGPSCEMDWGNQ